VRLGAESRPGRTDIERILDDSSEDEAVDLDQSRTLAHTRSTEQSVGSRPPRSIVSRRAKTLLALAAVTGLLLSAPVREAAASCRPEHLAALSEAGLTPQQMEKVCTTLHSATEETSAAGSTAGSPAGDAAAFSSDVLVPEIGNDGTWRKFTADGSYLLQNKSDAGSGYILLAEQSKPNWTSFGAKVLFTHEPIASGIVGAALVYENAGTGELTIYTLQIDGTVSSVRARDGDLTVLSTRRQPSWAVQDRTPVDLRIESDAGKTELFVNGTPTNVSVPCEPAALGKVGLAVFGIGSFEFQSFTQKAS
jgi:hypothetical protein